MSARGRGRGRGRSKRGAGQIAHSEGDVAYGSWSTGSSMPPPMLYPPLTSLPRPCERTEDDVFEIRKLRDLRHHMLHMAHRIARDPRSKDVERYSDKYRLSPGPTSVWGSVSCVAARTPAVFPAELVLGRDTGGEAGVHTTRVRSRTPNATLVPKWYEKKFSQLEEREKRTVERAASGAALERKVSVDEQELDPDAEQAEQDELSDDEYAMNYDSDEDYGIGGGDSDHEPTFE